MTEKMTITRALAELKLLESKIGKALNGEPFVSLVKGQKTVLENGMERTAFEKSVKASYDSINALMAKRSAIKSAIINSNATVRVTIGTANMTVAEAIVRKQTISTEVDLLQKMRKEWTNIQNAQTNNAQTLSMKLDNLIDTHFGNKNSKPTDDEIKAIAEPYTRLNATAIVDPLNLKDKIAELEDTIEVFQKDVDFILSESNTKTEIEVRY